MLEMHKRWCRDESGLAALEFALIAMPFFTLLMGVLELSLFFAAGTLLEGASNEAARLVRTGQAQLSADPETAFSDELCRRMDAMIVSCDELQYEVIRVEPNTFASAETYEPQFDADGNLIPQGFDSGNSNDVILIRAVYQYEFLTPFIGSLMTGDQADNTVTHMSTVVVKAEPYNFGEE